MGSGREVIAGPRGWLPASVAANGGEVNHPEAGLLSITVRRGVPSFRGRWVKGVMHITVPAECSVAEMEQVINRLVARLEMRRPTVSFSLSSPIVLPGLEIRFKENSLLPSRLIATPRLPITYIEFPQGFEPEQNPELLSKIIERIAGALAEQLLLPRARQLADEIGARPAGWKIGRGHKVLGTCSSRGVITLSSQLVLLPQHLRDYIVWHELAHLREMNHSARFHEICNAYCGGREARLRRELLHYPWPILR